MTKLGEPPVVVKPPRNPCWLWRLREKDSELAGDVVVALDEKRDDGKLRWTPQALADAVSAGLGERVESEAVRVHRRRDCATCNTHQLVPPKA